MKLFGIRLFDRTGPLLEKAELYLRSGRLSEAETLLRQVLETNPEAKQARELLRRVYRERDTFRAVYAVTEQLTPEEVAPPPAAQKGGEVERRRHPRKEDRRPVRLRALQKSETAPSATAAYNQNISAGGLFLVVEQDMPIGAFIEMKIELPPPEHPIYAIGKVVRKEEMEEEGKTLYGLGVKFTNIKPQDQERISKYAGE